MTTIEQYLSKLPPLLCGKQVDHVLNISRATRYRFVDDGRLAKPIKVGKGNRWKKDYIAELMQSGIPPKPEGESEPKQ